LEGAYVSCFDKDGKGILALQERNGGLQGMKYRDPLMVAVLSIVTFTIYAVVWYVKTKREMNSQGARIPTAWLVIIPIADTYWLWRFCKGLETVTKGKLNGGVTFLLLALTGYVGFIASVVVMATIQNQLNKVALHRMDNCFPRDEISGGR